MTTARYLVTGGAGFIGSHIVEALLNQGETVRVFDSLATGRETNVGALKGHAQFKRGDLRNFDDVKAAMRDVEVVFHQGALASVPRSIADPVASLETNINGTHNVLLAAKESGVRRVVYASSSSVYGDTPTLPKREDMPSNPMSPYAVHKYTGELLCRVFTHIYGLETVALRYFNVFGPRQDPNSEYAAVIPRFLTALIQKRRPIVFGDGQQTRDFTYITNVVQANLLAAISPDAIGRAINIGCGEQISLNTMLHMAGELLGITVEAEYREPRSGDVRHSLADITLAQRLLGYQPTIGFREGLARTLAVVNTEIA
ncbi:MAG TPA: LPS biosynthesis protein WbpP [Ktedonobacter sp.]|jgi:UDP-glucose 4-epimerase|nr:LPS biosynthesis protein WbpP [Ktedonobacter sp.]HAG97835.1 LPS biosynthesis protein WbpP [Ktedonobacter sp.]HAT44927.1 LPS biosynthesis protein WbpP [Ktedonobacter sp.]HBE24170.1 LPS biosynthesis protein WbpP [Ktedonobacter sp.]